MADGSPVVPPTEAPEARGWPWALGILAKVGRMRTVLRTLTNSIYAGGRAALTRSALGVAALILSTLLLPAAIEPQRPAKPLTKDGVMDLLRNYVPSERIAQLARGRGIDFGVTPDVEKELRQAGATDALIATLRELAPKPPPPPVLQIETAPAAIVSVDGKPVGRTGPDGRLGLATLTPGKHSVRLSLDGFRDYEQVIELVAGQTAKVTATLDRMRPTLLASPKPAELPGSQIESVESNTRFIWVSHGRVEGHLARTYSPAGAFSPDGSVLAAVSEDKIVLMNLRESRPQKILKPRLADITDLQIQSANFLATNQLFLLANGLIHIKGKGPGGPTPLLAFQWNILDDTLSGKVDAVGAKGGFAPARYFPQIGYLGLYKESNFDLWNPRTARGGRITLPDLTQTPNLFELSPDGQWLLLAQIASSSTPDPVVVKISEHRFVDSLRGHQGTVLSLAFSRDSKKVVTACEDGKVRIWSVGDWKLLQTLVGHQGPVHWAEFSPDGRWVASAGEDKTARIWSAEDGKLEQTLEESQAPLVTIAFSPNSEYVAASAEQTVQVWQRRAAN